MNFRSFPLFLGLLLLLSMSALQAQKDITVENIWQEYSYYPNYVPGFNFMNDGRHYARLENNKVLKYDITTGEQVDVLFDLEKASKIEMPDVDGYTFSPDESKILIRTLTESIYRRSSKAYYYIYDTEKNSLMPLYEVGMQSYATFSPDGTKVAFTYDNNLYWHDIASARVYPVTRDGEKNKIINGSTDWVYEEEFAFAKAFYWSPDSEKLAYYRFDETEVPEYTMMTYNDKVYPDPVTFKYPKVGEDNSKVSVHIYHIKKDQHIQVKPDQALQEYIPRVKWTKDPEQLCVFFMNRHQNKLKLVLAEAESGETRTILEEESLYYIDIHDNLRFLEDGKRFLWTSERNGYNHIYLHDIKSGKSKPLTSGKWDVTKFYGVDEENNKIYYQSAERSPLERHVYEKDLKGKNKRLLTPEAGTYSVQFSGTYDYFIQTHSTANSLPTYKVMDRKGNTLRVLEENAQFGAIMEEYGVQDVEFFKVPGGDGTELNGWRITPPDFDENKEYPLFMFVYGGPGSQTVKNAWLGMNYWWFQMLAQKGYVVISVDNRGTGARGEEFKKMTYLQLGKYEVEDQVAVAKYMGDQSYIDEERVGIFGWSYGGYLSSLCILKAPNVFKAAIAVAPVTNWKWYDTIYTERFMRTEVENREGYAENSPVYFADRLEGNYLLIHGTGDDNVHFQNSIEMANALINANKQFDTYFYPNRNHGIYGGNTRLHLYNKMTDFVMNKL